MNERCARTFLYIGTVMSPVDPFLACWQAIFFFTSLHFYSSSFSLLFFLFAPHLFPLFLFFLPSYSYPRSSVNVTLFIQTVESSFSQTVGVWPSTTATGTVT